MTFHQVHGAAIIGIVGVVVHRVKVVPVPLKGGIFSLATGAGEVGVAFDFLKIALGLEAVVLGKGGGFEGFNVVAPHFVVEHPIGIDLEPRVVEGVDGGEVLIAGAVFGGDRIPLIKFP